MSKITKTSHSFLLGFLSSVMLVSGIAAMLGLIQANYEDLRQANASNINCQSVATSPTWNPYPINTTVSNPIVNNPCQDMPMLSFFPVDVANGNPREKTIIQDEEISLHIYYNNGADPGSSAINNPRVSIEVVKESQTRYRIRGTLSGDNVSSRNSSQLGGDLIINVPTGTELKVVGSSTLHYPDAIERRAEADRTGARPYDQVPDNSTGTDNSNPIFSRFDGVQLGSSSGFQVKPQLEAGFLGYGYVLTKINADVDAVDQNTPPQIPGQEITIIRGQSGSFQALNPTDPENDIPISLNVAQVLPSFCRLTGTADSTGGGQIITCQTDANTPVRTEFIITPTDSRGLVGTPGTFIVNVIEPDLGITKTCFKLGTQTECNEAGLQVGDEVKYEITVNNPSTVRATNVRVVDDYDDEKIGDIKNITDNGQLNVNTGLITWANLGTLEAGASKKVSFEGKIKTTVENGQTVENVAKASADNIPEKEAEYNFKIGGDLGIEKTCFVKGTQTPCKDGNLKSGDMITYQLKITNSTQSTVTEVVVTDTYDKSKLTKISNLNPNGSVDVVSGKITWQLGSMEANSSKIITYDAEIIADVSGEIKNVATVKAKDIPEKTTEYIFTIGKPTLIVSKSCFRKGTQNSCASSTLLPGEMITYSIQVKNNSTVDAQNVRVIDTYDVEFLENIANINPTGSLNTNTGTIAWELGTLTANEERVLTFDAKIKSTTPSGTVIKNTVVASASGIPEQKAEVEFPVGIPTTKTPRSGGGLLILSLLGLGSAGLGGYVYYKNGKKTGDGFTPKRNVEDTTFKDSKTSIKSPKKKK